MPFQKFLAVFWEYLKRHIEMPAPWLGDGLYSQGDVQVGMGFTQLCALPHLPYMVVTKPQTFMIACYPSLHKCE